jgi:hypothetical protein
MCSAVYIAWNKGYVRFEVLIAVTMNNAVFWNMTVCNLTDMSEEPTALIFRK